MLLSTALTATDLARNAFKPRPDRFDATDRWMICIAQSCTKNRRNGCECVEALARYAQDTVGRVRIGTSATACIYFLPRVLRQLRARFPSLDIVVSTRNTPDVLKAIEVNAIDVGLVRLPSSGRMFDIKPVIADEFVVVSAIDGGRLPRRITPSDHANLPVVLYGSGAHTRLLIDQ
jgi:DNA-binding transcriptional LysR family regulator